MEVKELYQVGIYLRLSREDVSAGDSLFCGERSESNSIRSQREICQSFVRDYNGSNNHSDSKMEIYRIYVDDGYSGVTFERPSFRQMMEDVFAGRVDCIIVKDLSRFGREYIEAGRLIQKIFPAFHVRFISVTDHFDSLTANYQEAFLVLPVKNFVNDAYCRDISNKVRSHQRIKREKGEFLGAFPVYGYQKDKKKKNHLVPDEYAAGIVRYIFAWKLEGMSAGSIAKKLDKFGILSPLEYKKVLGENYTTSFATSIQARWSAMAVIRILTNEVYTGMLEQGKSEKINYKLNQYRKKPREEWIRIKHAHKPLVTEEEFWRVQKLLEMGTGRMGEKLNGSYTQLFAGFLFCGDCKKPMVRRINRYKGREKVCFICSTRNKGKGCTRHTIQEEELKEAVLTELNWQMSFLSDKKKILSHIGNGYRRRWERSFQEIRRFEQEMTRLQKERERCLSLSDSLERSLKKGVITQEDFYVFRNLYKEKETKIREAIEGQKQWIAFCRKSSAIFKQTWEQFEETGKIAQLERDVLLAFVETIFIYENKQVEIRFCLQEEQGRQK